MNINPAQKGRVCIISFNDVATTDSSDSFFNRNVTEPVKTEWNETHCVAGFTFLDNDNGTINTCSKLAGFYPP